ncbi:ninein isoform X4 [Cyprinodon tularosa]|uniref:ninein isoform X4 n=1 Tax=Cyprinodon tularosa TaxID=77115 RepID=UPI0018E2139D|nr:ninein isoform X4 [Cyprinodon tularosa]
MDDGQEQDNSEERLKEVFYSFDSSGCGSLSPEELSDLCQSLHLDNATPILLHQLLQDQDNFSARVNFDQFKHALILVLSSTIEPQAEEEPVSEPESPEIQPKFVKGSKRYGRRSTPELLEPPQNLSEVTNINATAEEDLEDNYDSAVPRKRERWNPNESSSEEYEAEGQMHLWNPDEPSTPRGTSEPLSARVEERLRGACEELEMDWDGCAAHSELLALCEHLGLEVNSDVRLSLTDDGEMSVQDFFSRVVNNNKPLTPSASTPYRQLKRHHSTQPFDEGGRRISTLTSTIGLRLFSTLDDGSGFSPAEYILDAWIEEGIENSAEILQALNFDLDGKLSLGDLTVALENELLSTKNQVHQAALASFKAEIRYLLERVDREAREKEKIRSDLEKAEKQKTQLATEVDEHHSAIEQMNNLNLRKLEQDYKEKLAAVRSELMKEMDQMQQQAGLQREELEAEMEKIREDESLLRDHLSISLKENRRLEVELLDSTEKLTEAQSQVTKLQANLENIMKEKFGDLDPGSADFFLQEERIKQLRCSYEEQCRELQDRIDELQSELREFHTLGRSHESGGKTLSEELESKSPGMESDPGIGSDEVQPFSMSLEAEMLLEQLKERHHQEMENLQNQLESKISEFEKMVEEHRMSNENQKATLVLQFQQEAQALKEELVSAQSHAQQLQNQLQQAELERAHLELKQASEMEELQNQEDDEAGNLRQQLLEAHTQIADLEDQLNSLESQQAEMDENLLSRIEELRNQHASEILKLKEEQGQLLEARLSEERQKLQREKEELEQRLLDDWEREKDALEVHLEEAKLVFEKERDERVNALTEEWQKESAQRDEQHKTTLQVLLEEETLRLVREQEEKEKKLWEQWESQRALLQERHEKVLLEKVHQERLQLQEQFEQRERELREEWEREKLQTEEDYERLIQDRLTEERGKIQTEREEKERRMKELIAEERARLEESHAAAMKELINKHAEERNALGAMLDNLRGDISKEREAVEISFTQRIRDIEDRFSCDQESTEERFQAQIYKLEERYQSELKTLSKSHADQQLLWEKEMQKVLDATEDQRKAVEEAVEQERERCDQEWENERQELENIHSEEMNMLKIENRQLLNELEEGTSRAQSKEIELSMQLNELHSRLQEKHQLLSQAEDRLVQTEQLLNQTVEDFKQERAELLGNISELQAKCTAFISLSERQVAERIQLLTERDDLRVKVEELETLLKQAALDFELERKEILENLVVLEEKLRETQEVDVEALRAERDALKIKIKELQEELLSALNGKNWKESNHISAYIEEKDGESCQALSDPDEDVLESIDEDEVDSDSATIEMDEQEVSENQDMQLESSGVFSEGCEDDAAAVPPDQNPGQRSPERSDPDSRSPDAGYLYVENNKVVVSREVRGEDVSLLQAFTDGKNKVAAESCNQETKPQEDCGSCLHADQQHHETVVGVLTLQETAGDPELSLEDAQFNCLLNGFSNQQESDLLLDCEHKHQEKSAQNSFETVDEENHEFATLKLQALYNTATEENVLLHEKISLLKQKTEILESLLEHHREKFNAARQALDENYKLKVQTLLLVEQVKELQAKRLKMVDLQIRYEDCMCENAKLRDQNDALENRVWSLEGRLDIFHDFRHRHASLVDEISRMRAENSELFHLLNEVEKQDELSDSTSDGERTERPIEETSLHCDRLEEESVEVGVQECCREFEEENGKLRRAIAELRDKSQIINQTTQAHRSEAARLAEENISLQKNISALKEGDLKEAKDELIKTLEHLEKEKSAAQQAADIFNKRISELQLQSQQLEDDKGTLTEKNAQSVADTEGLREQLAELIKENKKREAFYSEEKNKMAACVSAMEADLRKAVEDCAQLTKRNGQLSQQLSDLKEEAVRVESVENQLGHLEEERRIADKESAGLRNQLAKTQEQLKSADESVKVVNRQNSRLKFDVQVLQQERDSLKHEVTVLRKQLQNASDKNHILEMALHSSGLQSQSKKLYREGLSRLMEQEQQLLRQENERLKAELHSINTELVQSREKIRQHDATILSLNKQKQQSHSSLLRALEQENASLKQELSAKSELTKGCDAEQSNTELESLQQQNEALKAQMSRLSTQLMESFQVQFGGPLPASPQRGPRGQQRGEDPDNMQDEREKKMKNMEERMKEIELSLHNVKLLLKEKVSQLKDQLHRNGKADVLIKDLYVENSQLIKALEITEQRQKIAEKKNYLLEEKISSLNKIVRDLNPSTIASLPYNYKCP